jgi:hypothetical protein
MNGRLSKRKKLILLALIWWYVPFVYLILVDGPNKINICCNHLSVFLFHQNRSGFFPLTVAVSDFDAFARTHLETTMFGTKGTHNEECSSIF